MRELHGIIFSYEKRNELYELAEKRTAASLPLGATAAWTSSSPTS